MSRDDGGSFWGEFKQTRMIMVLVIFIAIWLKLGMIGYQRLHIPNAPYPYNNGGRSLVNYYVATALERVPHLWPR